MAVGRDGARTGPHAHAALVGRAAERRRLTKALSAHRSVLLTGDLGIGKTRLLEWTASQATAHGWDVAVVRATAGLSDVPFGAFAHLLPPPREGLAPNEVTLDLLAHLRTRAASGLGLLLVVDDAPRLDALSGAVLHQTVMLGVAVVVFTARSGEALPDGAQQLLGDRVVETIELDPLGFDDARRLAEAVAGRSISPPLASWTWNVAAGNPLFVTELVQDALDRFGAPGMDAIVGHHIAPAVADVVRARLGRLSPVERIVVETLAIEGAASLSTLESVGGPEALDSLETRRIIAVLPDGQRTRVQFAHPLFADALWGSMGIGRRRQLTAAAADRIEACGRRRRDDALTVAIARDTSGGHLPAELAEVAARSAHARGAAVLAERFARAAYEQAPSVMRGILLSYGLMYQAKPAEADELMASLEPLIVGDDERALLASTQSLNAMHGLMSPARAAAILGHHVALVAGPWRYELLGSQLGIALYEGRIRDAVAGLDAILADPDVPPRAQLAALLAGLIPLYLSGRTTDAIRYATSVQSDFESFAGGVPTVRLQAELELAEALAWHGDERGARAILDRLHTVVRGADNPGAHAIVTIVDGLVRALNGEHEESTRALAELGSLDGSPFSPWVPHFHSRLACAALRTGAEAAGRAHIELAIRATRPGLCLHELSLRRAEAELEVLIGEVDVALSILDEVSSRAARVGHSAEGLFSALRRFSLDADDAARRSAVQAAGRFDGPLGSTLRQCLEQIAVNERELVAGIHGTVRHGHRLLALDLADGARLRLPNAAFEGLRGVDLLRARTTLTPAPSLAANRPQWSRLTNREREVATLVAEGSTDLRIAEALGLSLRTVHAHVRSIFTKLGVTQRSQLRGSGPVDQDVPT